jgi:hypothetical protein
MHRVQDRAPGRSAASRSAASRSLSDHRRRWLRGPAVALAAVAALLAGACAAPSAPAGPGGIDVDFGPVTIPLPPIEVRPPATSIPLGPCSAGYQPPGVVVRGATVTIPGIRIDPSNPIITVPNVVVTIPQLRIPAATATVSCLFVSVQIQPELILPSTVFLKAVTLNLDARTITIHDPTFQLNGVGLAVGGLPLGDIVLPLPPIVNVPLPSGAIAF